jgi:hypothetical protein
LTAAFALDAAAKRLRCVLLPLLHQCVH